MKICAYMSKTIKTHGLKSLSILYEFFTNYCPSCMLLGSANYIKSFMLKSKNTYGTDCTCITFSCLFSNHEVTRITCLITCLKIMVE